MPESPSPRPQLKQNRSSGWGWPHLVDAKEQQQQKDKVSPQAKNKTSAVSKRVSPASTAPSSPSRNLPTSSDLSTLKEEEGQQQSASTSPEHSPGSPRENMSGHRAEASENANAGDDQPQLDDAEAASAPVPRDEIDATEGQDVNSGEQGVDENAAEGVGKDAEHPNDSLPGAFPITPAPATSPGDRFPGLVQAGLIPTDEESGTTSLGQQYPGLARAGLLPAIDEAPAAKEPDAEVTCDCGDVCQCRDLSRSVESADHPKSCTCLQQCHCPETEGKPEYHAAEPGNSVKHPKKDRRVSISEPNKPLPIPTITIQRPSNSDISDIDDDKLPAQSSPAPRSHTVDSVRAEERRGTESLSLRERLEEERRITSPLTQEDRDRIVQDIATDIASIPDPANKKREIQVPVEVKKRMKVRRAVVRSPVLKLLLGRQLAGPAKEILRMRATGQAVSLAEVSGIPTKTAGGGLLQH